MSKPLSGAQVLSSKERAYLVHADDEEGGIHCGANSNNRTLYIEGVTCIACLEAIQADAEATLALCLERKRELKEQL